MPSSQKLQIWLKPNCSVHQTRRSRRLLRLGFNEVAQFLSKSEVSVALSVFSSSPYFFHQWSYFFFNIHIKGAPMFLKSDQYRVWCSIFYFKLVNCILLRPMFVFVKGRGTCGSGERNVKIWINFRKSPRFSLTSPSSQERERSQVTLILLCVVSPGGHYNANMKQLFETWSKMTTYERQKKWKHR